MAAVDAYSEAVMELAEAGMALRERVSGLAVDRAKVMEERDHARQEALVLREALKLLIADCDAMRDVLGGTVDAVDFELHLQAARELVDAGSR